MLFHYVFIFYGTHSLMFVCSFVFEFSESHEASVMVLGAICWWGKTRLVFFSPDETVKAKHYLAALKRTIIPDVKELFECDKEDEMGENEMYPFIWMQVIIHTKPSFTQPRLIAQD
jgi:hypothetical protein